MLESRALRGAVAQLGERRVRNAKVEGSIPFRSTSFANKNNKLRDYSHAVYARLSIAPAAKLTRLIPVQ